MITLTTRSHIDSKAGCHVDRFDVFLDGEQILTTRSPLLDGARELLRRGQSPDALMTTRVHNRAYDNFKPVRIGYAAKWVATEESRDGLRLRKWEPLQNGAGYPDIESALRGRYVEGTRDTPEASDAVRPDRTTAMA